MYILISLTITGVLPLLDSSVVNIIIPSLSVYFSSTADEIQWIITVYFMFSVLGLLLTSVLQRKIQIKTLWSIGICLFSLSSLLIGCCTELNYFIAFRAVQGLSSGLLLPLVQSIIALQFGKEKMREVMGIIAVPAVFAPAIGPLLGGVINQYLSWQIIFFINIPLTLVALFLGMSAFSKEHFSTDKSFKFDYITYFLFSVSLVMAFYILGKVYYVYSNEYIYFFGLSVIMFLIAIYRNGKSNSILNLSFFRCGIYSSSIVIVFLISFVFYGFLIFYPQIITIDTDNDISSSMVGFLLCMQGIGAWVGRKYIMNGLKHKSNFYIMSLGVFISACSLLFFGRDFYFDTIGFLIRGIGLGIATIASMAAPMEFVEKEYLKDTSVIIRLVQQAAGAVAGLFAGVTVYLVHQHYMNVQESFYLFMLISFLISIYVFSSKLFYMKTFGKVANKKSN